jgi:hypothetical protein
MSLFESIRQATVEAIRSESAMRIKVMPDYDCHPLWWDAGSNEVGNIDPKELGLSNDLSGRLQDWAREFDETLNRDDPVRSGFSSPDAERGFLERGRQLARLVSDELGASASVRYWPSRT